MARGSMNLARVTGSFTLLIVALVLLPLVFRGQGSLPDGEGFEAEQAAILVDGQSLAAINSFVPLPEIALAPDQEPDQEPILLAPSEAVPLASAVVALASVEPQQVVAAPVVVPPLPTPDLGHAGWALQLASFSQMANAERIMQQLQDQQWPAFIREVRGERVLYQVLVGPFNNEAQAREQQPRLQQQFDLSPLVIRYQP